MKNQSSQHLLFVPQADHLLPLLQPDKTTFQTLIQSN